MNKNTEQTYIVWIVNSLGSGKASPQRFEASSPEAAEKKLWARIKPKDHRLITVVKVELESEWKAAEYAAAVKAGQEAYRGAR